MRNFLEKCQKIAGCWGCVVYVPNLHISTPQERPGLDKITSQPWFDATCPCTTSWSAELRFVTLFLLKRTRQNTSSGVTGASCVRPWLTRTIVWTGSFRREWARFRGDRRLGTYTARPQHPAIFWHFCGNFRSVRGPLHKLPCRSMYEKRPRNVFVPVEKKGAKIDPHVSNLTPIAGPIFGPLSTRLMEGFHFEDNLISRFYFVPNPSNLVGKDFQ